MELTNADVADILALLDSLPYDEFDLRTPRFRLTLRRTADGAWTQESQLTAEPVAQDAHGTSTAPPPDKSDMPGQGGQRDGAHGDGSHGDGAHAGGADAGESGSDGRLVAVAAPLPGTFYRAPRPGAAPFVEVGDAVSEDTVVAIVETMKMMNSVPAGAHGRIAEIRPANAEPVAQGATLMLIEPETEPG